MSDELAAGDVTAGQLLRRAREAAGLHVAALAVSLKVPVRKLEALEDNRYDQLPDAVFARALAASVCRTLKIDPQPVLDRLPQTGVPRLLRAQGAINAPFRAPHQGTAPSWFDQLPKPVFVVVFALLLGALVLIFLPDVQRVQSALMAPAPPPPAESSAPVQGPLSAVSTVDSSPALISPTAVLTPSPALAMAGQLGGGSAGAVAGAAAVNTPAQASEASGVVVFKATAASWVQVTDARGAPVLRKLLEAGESAGASGAGPLTVTIGRADATLVQVRGKPFDLAAVSRDNVARFEVK